MKIKATMFKYLLEVTKPYKEKTICELGLKNEKLIVITKLLCCSMS